MLFIKKGKVGHIGPLCEKCDIKGNTWGTRYIQDKMYTCSTCKEKGPGEIAGAIVMTLFIFGYTYMGIKTTF